MRTSSEKQKFSASDVKEIGGVTYRQLNDWDSKGALPRQRKKKAGWRKFDPKQFFVVLVCAEIRKQFGVSIEKLAWLQRFMLQDGADHFSVAVTMMRHGLVVVILTDLSQQFDMDADFAIGDLLGMGYCRRDDSQSYVMLSVNPLINKMLGALKTPLRLQVSDRIYSALRDAQALTRIRDTAELAILRTLRESNISKITITPIKNTEVLLEIEQRPRKKDDVHLRGDKTVSRKIVKKVVREKIGITAVRLDS